MICYLTKQLRTSLKVLTCSESEKKGFLKQQKLQDLEVNANMQAIV